ncbi:CLUMA_CG012608, isoform A [Clunio marinus]|uniref:CLUMA_CG012608, isoform A n=1 Tax=Clunio marinus TaxID=568069 RepID=A0A1J1ILP0_9DIPT|nr:CLUMA_CG012608, isoform A [Clunio marinus]
MNESLNDLVFNNPVSNKIISATKKILFKNGNNSSTSVSTMTKNLTTPSSMTLFQQGGHNSSVFIRLAGFSGATAVILGAYGAHKTQWPTMTDPKRDPKIIFEVANKYHFYNSIALLAIPLVKRPWLTGPLMITGILLFSGTCYYSALTGDQKFNRLAPLGGTSLILAWVSMMWF